MAEVKTIQKAVFPLSSIIKTYMQQTTDDIQMNIKTQKIWPYEVYPGYAEINEQRKEKNQWYSTGEGAKSIRGRIISATPDYVHVEFTMLQHMRFADMGVGQGTSYEDVQTQKKANYRRRYIRKWNRFYEGMSHRPAIMMTIRHLGFRMEKYVENFYGKSHVSEVFAFPQDPIYIDI